LEQLLEQILVRKREWQRGLDMARNLRMTLLATKTTKLLHQGGLNVLSRTFRARSCGNKSVVASATTAANATVAIFVTYDAIIATNYPKHKYVVV